MRYFTSVGLGGTALGAAFGAAMIAGPAALAETGTSPIDTWLYSDSPAGINTLPGIAEPELPDTYYHIGSLKPWYTADVTDSGDTTQTTVTKILDPSYGYPSTGTAEDKTAINFPDPYSQPESLFNLYTDVRLTDPNLGTGDFSSYFNGAFTNFYVSDAAGIEDQMTFGGGTPITLFDFPAADTGSSEAGDWLTQLISDIFGGVAGSTTAPDLF